MELNAIYKCNICGNVVEAVAAFEPPVSCCGEEMQKLEEQTEDYKIEKHVPVVKESKEGIEVVVGSTLHPMTEEHHIVFIEVLTRDNKVLRADLEATGAPRAVFSVKKDNIDKVREYCNIHDLWKA